MSNQFDDFEACERLICVLGKSLLGRRSQLVLTLVRRKLVKRKTLAALKASIQHWEENAKVLLPFHASVGARHCALCLDTEVSPHNTPGPYIVDLEARERAMCRGCPVFEKVHRKCCDGTPFPKASFALSDWRSLFVAAARYMAAAGFLEDEECAALWDYASEAHAVWVKAAKKEAAFLRSLLPPEAQPKPTITKVEKRVKP